MITLTRKQFKKVSKKQLNRWLRDGYSVRVIIA